MHRHAAPQVGLPEKTKIFQPRASNAEARAPFRATRTQYCATAASFHANPESMRTLAAGGGRLIGPFHDFCPNRLKSPLLQPLTSTSVNPILCDRGDREMSRVVDNFYQKR